MIAGPSRWNLLLARLPMALAVAVLISACQPSPPPGETGMLDVRTPRFTSDGVQGCLLCHAGSAYQAVESTAHGDPSNPASPYGQNGCESCHGPGSFHVSRAHGGKGVPPLDSLADPARQAEACFSCHETQRTDHVMYRGRPLDFTQRACSRCHAVHR